jgi:hypothetical protein
VLLYRTTCILPHLTSSDMLTLIIKTWVCRCHIVLHIFLFLVLIYLHVLFCVLVVRDPYVLLFIRVSLCLSFIQSFNGLNTILSEHFCEDFNYLYCNHLSELNVLNLKAEISKNLYGFLL